MTAFVNMWKNYFNFRDRTTRSGFWLAILFWVIFSMIPSILFSVTESLFFMVLFGIYLLASIIPMIALEVRRFRDAGRQWWWMFIPIANIVFLFTPSVPDDGTPVV